MEENQFVGFQCCLLKLSSSFQSHLPCFQKGGWPSLRPFSLLQEWSIQENQEFEVPGSCPLTSCSLWCVCTCTQAPTPHNDNGGKRIRSSRSSSATQRSLETIPDYVRLHWSQNNKETTKQTKTERKGEKGEKDDKNRITSVQGGTRL